MQLTWHQYRYYPYEKDLASREVKSLLHADLIEEAPEHVRLVRCTNLQPAERLTYFSSFANGHGATETIQSRLEDAARNGKRRQATRYSVHGIHEYKGKFNPQIVKAILNIFSVQRGDNVVDPFCGSGTTLVECAHIGAFAQGFDINPLAVHIANAKLLALQTPASHFEEVLLRLQKKIARTKKWQACRTGDDARLEYLSLWFRKDILGVLETLKDQLQEICGPLAPIFLVIASNLLREYSLQDPNDLRIRRRKSPLPKVAFQDSFIFSCQQFVSRLAGAQSVLGVSKKVGRASLRDVSELLSAKQGRLFDAAITSPPYAMALPYIDTQRLSLVWLGLLPSKRILGLESELIGSRETRGADRASLIANLQSNAAGLPPAEIEFCLRLQRSIGPNDGFRRKAVPFLLYRYLAAMQGSFTNIRKLVKRGGRYALIVGHNHSVLGGKRFDINTPSHLASIASSAGWQIDELIPLQTYHRYGYHSENAVNAETLLLLRNI